MGKKGECCYQYVLNTRRDSVIIISRKLGETGEKRRDKDA